MTHGTCNRFVIRDAFGVFDTSGPCSRMANNVFGDMQVCSQHHTQLVDGAKYWLRNHAEEWEIAEILAARESNKQHRQRIAAAERRSRVISTVYFVRRDCFIKIGVTTNLKARLASLSMGGVRVPKGMKLGPVTLLATMPGNRANESYLHGRFAAHRVGDTEWFYPHPEVIAFIEGLQGFVRDGGLTPVRRGSMM